MRAWTGNPAQTFVVISPWAACRGEFRQEYGSRGATGEPGGFGSAGPREARGRSHLPCAHAPVTSLTREKKPRLRSELMPQLTGTLW